MSKAIDEGKVTVCVRRNELPREGSPRFQRLILTLKGSLPEEAVGEIWELKVQRQGNKLSIAKGKPYQPSAEDLAWLHKAKQNNFRSNEITSTAQTTAESTVNAVGKESDEALALDHATQLKASLSDVNQKAETTTTTSRQSKRSARPEGAQRKTAKLFPLADESASKKQPQPQEKSAAMSAKQNNQHLQQSEKNCAGASTIQMETQRQKPAFQVKVNDQIFSGYNSVTLNKRVVRIDGKPVAQAKMALVLGQPSSIYADGGVTRGRNQAVLMGM